MKKVFAMLLCLMMTGVFCTACQPPANTEDAREVVNKVSDDQNTLQDQTKQLRKENGYLRASNVEMSLQIQSLEEENANLQKNITGTDAASLLNMVAASDRELEVFPAYVKSVKPDAKGYELAIDRLKINPDFEIGGLGEEGYLINEEEKIETLQTDGPVIINYDGISTYEVDPDFTFYINGQDEPGGQFTFYMLGDKILLMDEILVP